MENVFMDSEDNLTNTMEVLQTELDLSIEDIKAIQSKALPAILSYPRSELRKRILVYKLDLGYPTEEIKKMVLKDPRMLRTNSDNVRQILKVLREELDVGKEDVHAMLHKEILLLTYNAEDNIRPTIQFLKTCEFGLCLGMVERKGVSTLSVSTEAEQEEIIQSRLKTIIMGHPKILSSSLEKNLKPTVEFFVRELGLSMHEFGRVIYRRGGSLLEANVERNLRPKVDFLRSELGLELDADFEQEDGENPIGFCVANNNDQPIKVEAPFPELKSQKDGKVATRASTNEMNPTNVEKKRLLAQMLATVPDILTLSIENNLKPKFSYLRGTLGFSRDQVRFIVLKRPQLLALSLDNNIIPKIDYFLKERRKITAKTNADTYRGGLGMSKEEIREWIVKYPQTLTFVLESRIRPRVFDAVRLGLGVGDEESQAPMNFVTRSDRSWKYWMDA
jgi:DNA-binding transcriptional MerR regulator